MSHRQPFWGGVVITALLVLTVVWVALVPLAHYLALGLLTVGLLRPDLVA